MTLSRKLPSLSLRLSTMVFEYNETTCFGFNPHSYAKLLQHLVFEVNSSKAYNSFIPYKRVYRDSFNSRVKSEAGVGHSRYNWTLRPTLCTCKTARHRRECVRSQDLPWGVMEGMEPRDRSIC